MIIDGRIEGIWEKIVNNNAVTVEITPFSWLNKAQEQAARQAIKNTSPFQNNPKKNWQVFPCLLNLRNQLHN
jgi:hypothetical protein